MRHHAVARHRGREGVPSQRVADGARGRGEEGGEGRVCGDVAWGDLEEEEEGAALEGGERGGGEEEGFFWGGG